MFVAFLGFEFWALLIWLNLAAGNMVLLARKARKLLKCPCTENDFLDSFF